jgi:hypothetical protein
MASAPRGSCYLMREDVTFVVAGVFADCLIAVVLHHPVSINKIKISTSAQISLRLHSLRHLRQAAKIWAPPLRTHRRPPPPHLWTKQPLQGQI